MSHKETKSLYLYGFEKACGTCPQVLENFNNEKDMRISAEEQILTFKAFVSLQQNEIIPLVEAWWGRMTKDKKRLLFRERLKELFIEKNKLDKDISDISALYNKWEKND